VVFFRGLIRVCFFSVGVLLAGCAAKNLVVLAPDPVGGVGQITVSNAAGSVDITTANAFTAIKDPESPPSTPAGMDPAKIQDLFGRALAAQPLAPVHFILHFKMDSTDLLPESVDTFPEIIAAIHRRGSEMVSVVGHSDTAGDKTYNLRLSTRRAVAVRDRLVEMGIAEGLIDVSSHGEENPLIKTGDNVKNEKNRRVEVVIR
jgi:outer membrane protein OmpA-like peptidoglycan-associated protein